MFLSHHFFQTCSVRSFFCISGLYQPSITAFESHFQLLKSSVWSKSKLPSPIIQYNASTLPSAHGWPCLENLLQGRGMWPFVSALLVPIPPDQAFGSSRSGQTEWEIKGGMEWGLFGGLLTFSSLLNTFSHGILWWFFVLPFATTPPTHTHTFSFLVWWNVLSSCPFKMTSSPGACF